MTEGEIVKMWGPYVQNQPEIGFARRIESALAEKWGVTLKGSEGRR